MVRVLVAFLIEVGKGKREPEEIPKLLEAKDRKQIPFTAPPEGLYLERIYRYIRSKYNPSGGAVKGICFLSFASNSFGISSGSLFPLPTSIRNATNTLTILYRNPEPVTT